MELQCISGEPGICVAEYFVPKEIPSSYSSEFFLEAEEELLADGSYSVVCGVRGRILKPFLILSGGRRSFVHARFSVPRRLVTVTANDDRVSIEEHRLVVMPDPNILELQTRICWEGRHVDLPYCNGYKCFRSAVSAAVLGERYYRTGR
ncbi:MAG: hypothetical protein WC243_02960 [Patescibacteria group bacterium]